jgi:dolichyl-phosphate-mannose--protein O-mannosyl transferase
LVGVYGLLAVLTLLTDRLSYEYYFYPAVPAVCLSIACGIWKLWELARGKQTTRVIFRACLAFYLLAVVLVFIIMSPLGTHLVRL